MEILITEKELTKNTPLGSDIDKEKLRQCVLDAQSIRLEEILGENLYEKIETDYVNGTLDGDYKKFHEEYIIPFLIRQSAAEYLKIGAFSISNNGISMPLPQNSTSVTDVQLSNLLNDMATKADTYAMRMERALCKFNFPEWKYDTDAVINPKKPTITNWYYE